MRRLGVLGVCCAVVLSVSAFVATPALGATTRLSSVGYPAWKSTPVTGSTVSGVIRVIPFEPTYSGTVLNAVFAGSTTVTNGTPSPMIPLMGTMSLGSDAVVVAWTDQQHLTDAVGTGTGSFVYGLGDTFSETGVFGYDPWPRLRSGYILSDRLGAGEPQYSTGGTYAHVGGTYLRGARIYYLDRDGVNNSWSVQTREFTSIYQFGRWSTMSRNSSRTVGAALLDVGYSPDSQYGLLWSRENYIPSDTTTFSWAGSVVGGCLYSQDPTVMAALWSKITYDDLAAWANVTGDDPDDLSDPEEEASAAKFDDLVSDLRGAIDGLPNLFWFWDEASAE